MLIVSIKDSYPLSSNSINLSHDYTHKIWVCCQGRRKECLAKGLFHPQTFSQPRNSQILASLTLPREISQIGEFAERRTVADTLRSFVHHFSGRKRGLICKLILQKEQEGFWSISKNVRKFPDSRAMQKPPSKNAEKGREYIYNGNRWVHKEEKREKGENVFKIKPKKERKGVR